MKFVKLFFLLCSLVAINCVCSCAGNHQSRYIVRTKILFDQDKTQNLWKPLVLQANGGSVSHISGFDELTTIKSIKRNSKVYPVGGIKESFKLSHDRAMNKFELIGNVTLREVVNDKIVNFETPINIGLSLDKVQTISLKGTRLRHMNFILSLGGKLEEQLKNSER